MKRVYVLLVGLVLMLGCVIWLSPAHADQVSAQSITSVDVAHLSPEDRAKVLAMVTKMQDPTTDATQTSQQLRAEASKWGQLGMNVGVAAVSAAKQIGMAANDFVNTPLGKVTMAIIVYKIIGADVIHVISFSSFALMTFLLGLYFFRKPHGHVTYDYKPFFWGLWNRRVVVAFVPDSDYTVAWVLCGAISIIVSIFFAANIV